MTYMLPTQISFIMHNSNMGIEYKNIAGHILSVGDRIPCLNFNQIHSRFDNAINFVYNDRIISLVTPKIDAGPFRISVDNIDLQTVMEMRVYTQKVILNQRTELSFSVGKTYLSLWEADNIYFPLLRDNLDKLKTLLLTNGCKESLTILLRDEIDLFNIGKFEQEFYKQMRQAYANLLQKNIVEAVVGFKGRGYGQTPSGDDFNTGLLMGLNVRQHCEKKKLSKIRDSIYTNSLGKNLLVNTFLLQAYNGWYNENWKNLLAAITGQSSRIEEAAQQILAQGYSSGADTLTGFLTAWDVT